MHAINNFVKIVLIGLRHSFHSAVLKRQVVCYKLELGNDYPTFRLNVPVVIRAIVNSNVCSHFLTFHPDDDWSIQSKHQQVIFQAQVGNR